MTLQCFIVSNLEGKLTANDERTSVMVLVRLSVCMLVGVCVLVFIRQYYNSRTQACVCVCGLDVYLCAGGASKCVC